MHHVGKEPFPTIYVDGKEEEKKYEVAAKSQLKKIQKIWQREVHKAADKAKAEDENNEKRLQNLEEAKKIVIKEDPNLPKAAIIKISESEYGFYFLWLMKSQSDIAHISFVSHSMLIYFSNIF